MYRKPLNEFPELDEWRDPKVINSMPGGIGDSAMDNFKVASAIVNERRMAGEPQNENDFKALLHSINQNYPGGGLAEAEQGLRNKLSQGEFPAFKKTPDILLRKNAPPSLHESGAKRVSVPGPRDMTRVWDGTPDERNPWKPDFSLNENNLPRGLVGAKDDLGRRTHRGLFGGILSGAEDLFNDPRRMALIAGGLRMADPNSYYDKQGFYSPWGGINAGLGTGIKTYRDLSEPKKLGFEAQEAIKHKNAMALEKAKYRTPLNLDSKDSYMYSRARKLNPTVTPEDIASNKYPIPLQWHQDYAEMNKLKAPDTTYKSVYTTEQAKNDASLVESINENAGTAMKMNSELEAQMNLLMSPEAEETFGPGADWKHHARRFGYVLGLPVDSDKITKYEGFAKSTMEMLLEQLRKQKGPQTEGDASRALQTLPQAANSILGSKYIIAMKRAINARAIAKAKFMDKYMNDERRGDDVGYPKGLSSAWYNSDIGGRSIFHWMAEKNPDVIGELYEKKILTGKDIEEIVLEME